MTKKLQLFALIVMISSVSFAQVGIGTTTPDASAALDVSSTEKGFLMPRMTSAQRTAIASPATSLTVFDTDTNTFWTYGASTWVEAKPGGKFIDGASSDIAYYDGKVGIGIDNFSNVHKLYVESIKDIDGSHAAVRIDATYNGTGTAATTYGLGAVARNNSTGTINYAVGTQGIVQNVSGGSIFIGTGTWPQVSNSGTMSYGYGMIAEVSNSGTIDTETYAQNVSITNNTGASMAQASLSSMYMDNEGAITGNAYGLWIGGVGSGSVGGNSYALYIDTPFSNVTGDNFALYSANTADSFIQGNLGVGTDSPQRKVHISGALRLEPQATAPAGGSLGDLYVGTDTNLYFHDGTGWRQVQLVP